MKDSIPLKDADGETNNALGFFSRQRVTIVRMAKAQAQRALVERIFEEGKNILGMADYQTRKSNGFHRMSPYAHLHYCS